MIDMDTRLRAAGGIGKTETEASEEAFQTLKRRGHPDVPPATVSDLPGGLSATGRQTGGWGGIREAMVEVYGQVPPYSGLGRPPTIKRAVPGWKYLQGIKQRQNGHVVRTSQRVVYGDEKEVLELLGGSTAYVERTHLTSRLFNSRLVRKTLGFSKCVEMHRAATAWEDIVYNLIRPLKTLRRKVQDDSPRRWLPTTPGMAAGLTDHIWIVKELLTTLPTPTVSNT